MTDTGLDLCLTVVVRGSERYLWLWWPRQAVEVIRSAARFAEREDLAFSWRDAAHVAMRVRKQAARNGEN